MCHLFSFVPSSWLEFLSLEGQYYGLGHPERRCCWAPLSSVITALRVDNQLNLIKLQMPNSIWKSKTLGGEHFFASAPHDPQLQQTGSNVATVGPHKAQF